MVSDDFLSFLFYTEVSQQRVIAGMDTPKYGETLRDT